MKHNPRYAVFNFVCAIFCYLGGLVLLLCGIADLRSPRIWENQWGNLRSSTAYGVFWGVLWMVLGALGIKHYWQYFQERKDKPDKPDKQGKNDHRKS